MVKGKKANLVTRLLVGAGLVTGGCGGLNPMQEQTMYTLMGWGYDYTMQQERNKAIRESGTQVNVNITGQNKTSGYAKPTTQTAKKTSEYIEPITQQKEKEKIPDSFVFNYIEENDKDDILEYKEIKGINKTVFSQYESIYAGSSWLNCSGSIITSQIKNEEGKILDITPFKLKRDVSIFYHSFRPLAGLSGIYKFTAEWYKNGKQVQEKTINFFVDYDKKWEEVPSHLRRLPEIFFCNKYQDFKTGYTTPEEYGDIRNIFKPQEDIYALCFFENKVGEIGSLNIVSLDNRRVLECGGALEDNLIRAKTWFINYKFNADYIKKQLGGNLFRADWYSNGVRHNSLEFKILDE